jgi:hypothetical protein
MYGMMVTSNWIVNEDRIYPPPHGVDAKLDNCMLWTYLCPIVGALGENQSNWENI